MFIGLNEPCTDKTMYDQIDLEDDLQWNYTLMNFPTTEFLMSSADQFDFSKSIERPLSPKSQIRNHDCMWSGRCTTHPEKMQCNNNFKLKLIESKKPTAGNDENSIFQPKKIGPESIPAGRSLLINSRLNQPKLMVLKIPTVTTNDFLKQRELIARPDTPLSLEDDPPEFKHTIDLAACTMGSNKMSLISENETPTEIINMLKEHLEDHTGNQPHLRNRFSTFSPDTKNESLTDLLKDIKCLSDFEDDDSAEEMDSDTESSTGNTPIISSQSSSYDFNQTMHSDHSYTRSKNRVDVIGLGVQTPSDSGNFKIILL